MSLQAFLQEKLAKGEKIAILGVGSELMSDDAVGMYLIERLSGCFRQEDVLLAPGSTAPENFTGVIKNFAPSKLFIVDAAYMGLPPGEMQLLDKSQIEGLSFSTHMLPLPVMLNYLQLELGCEVICIGIQPACTEFGLAMCDTVRASAENLAQLFIDALQK